MLLSIPNDPLLAGLRLNASVLALDTSLRPLAATDEAAVLLTR